ncbi:bifunctional adenosylcobinamide kinase/adenosylcobinamide-phosphate guanylyltransferase [Solihabitans fulvus]|uniref:bifunctional adenosylcobinamide kinase/adenosylcobinamide-phosphate guanylyltransferase n=1 Tax=Solihabitans fulvus TaxID=1892852 RepID=UPI001CB764A6|nr:bifunctional adenosylcobinamide kinase/adenosylcobinamide-phosphate guanylyltransferase [Solihabitans fulvus]
MTRRTLVLGGARSGKSAHAEGLLADAAAVTYVATARRDPQDQEWAARIAAHVDRRPPSWRTVETTDVAALLDALGPADPPVLIDDAATWLTGVLDDCGAWEGAGLDEVAARCGALVASVARCRSRVALVSAEVGLGVIPATRSGRLFRDQLGSLNARLAEVCDEVLLLVAGLPLRLR